tara:strand:+ start:508 stop:708 length:201 start_codon:yes stop_codon:yes gene_type:complete
MVGGGHGRSKELARTVSSLQGFIVVKVNHSIIHMGLSFRSIVSGILEFLQVGLINVASDVFSVETT